MRLRDILKKDAIVANLKSSTKEEVLKELVDNLGDDIRDKKKIVKILIERENMGSTGLGQGIAVPHGKTDDIDKIIATIGMSKQGIEFNSLDGEPVYIFFLLIASKKSAGPHLKALARISRILRDASFCGILKKAKDKEEIYRLIIKEDEKDH
ncbi:MAG: PTS sugar transporter subunit IIA [Candidatus Omnitrophica bacterium]|nr:PTS sugar transporter subunit IIA [Candidatus Omnitrophota bacterium]